MKSLEASRSSVWFTFTFYYTLFLFAWELIFDKKKNKAKENKA